MSSETSVRLLAHGGTSYTERRRIGQWPTIPVGALEDTSSLSRDSLSFGLSLHEYSSPAAIFRRRQQAEKGRSYAYTVLLDPGLAVWKRFEWNAAGLILALLDSGFQLHRQLLSEPEQIEAESLGQALAGLVPSARSEDKEVSADFHSVLVGASVRRQFAIVSERSLGFSASPTVEQVASHLDRLPVCFRSACGWLIGGNLENARAFGCQVVLAETGEDADLEILKTLGQHVLRDWNSVEADRDFSGCLKEVSGVPLWQWERICGFAPELFLDRLSLLAGQISSGGGGKYRGQDSRATAGQTVLPVDGPLAAEIRQAARRAALGGDKPLGPAQTLLVLRDFLDRQIGFESSTVARLDLHTVIDLFTSERRRPDQMPPDLSLPEKTRRAIWLKLISTETTSEELPELLVEAANDLGRDSELVDAAIGRTDRLSVWKSFSAKHTLWPVLAERLSTVARKRVENQLPNWPIDYLLFGADPGGHTLASMNRPDHEIGLLVERLLSEVISNGTHQDDAREWLDHLAGSPLRLRVPIEKKLELAQRLDAKWSGVEYLLDSYFGRTGRKMDPVTAFEKKYLLVELAEIIRKFRDDAKVPDLKTIVAVLKILPAECPTGLSDLRPRLSWETAPRWIDGWRSLHQNDLVQSELVRLVVESDRPVPQDFDISQIHSDGLNTILSSLFFEGAEDSDKHSVIKLESILLPVSFRDHLRSIVAETLMYMTGTERQTTFLRRFGSRPLQSAVFDCLSTSQQDGLIKRTAQTSEARFLNEVYEVYRETLEAADKLEGPPDLSLYAQGIFRFLASDSQARVKIGNLYHGLPSAHKIEEHLRACGFVPLDSDWDQARDRRQGWFERTRPGLERKLPQAIQNWLTTRWNSQAAADTDEKKGDRLR
ncbi:MAG: hypothetical protein ACR2L2_06325 [Acidobacteriota bacterium]